MATATAITPTHWQAWQNAQAAARNFFRAPEGPAGKKLVTAFQRNFNVAIEAIGVIISARGGNPAQTFSVIPGGVPLKVDGAYGVATNYALGIIILFSFPSGVEKTAAGELMTAPYTRARVATWAKRFSSYVANMVSPDYAALIAQDPTVTEINAQATVNQSQTETQNLVDSGKNPVLEAQTTSTTSKPINQPIQTFDPVNVTASASPSYTWVWWTGGLAALGGALWWFFGRKARG